MKAKQWGKLSIFRASLAASAIFLLAGAGTDDSQLAPAKQAGDITYRSGGVGEDEWRVMKADAPNYSLTVIFATHIGTQTPYVSPDHVAILRSDGTSALDIKPDGPYLLVNLPAGNYRITASSAGDSRVKEVQVAAGAHKRVVFDMAPGQGYAR
jgi:hypothetical protein